MMVSFYCAGLYFYLLYRYRAPRFLYPALVLFALAFYSYNPAQLVVPVTGILLLLSDIRYHWQNRRTALIGLGILVLLALPYLRFYLSHNSAPAEHLSSLGSYWTRDIPWQEKLVAFRDEYLYGISPGYWFVPNLRDLSRHRMEGFGHLLSITLPLAFLGAALALWNIRSSAHRAVLAAFIAAPAGAALVQVAVTRALVMVIPATLLTALGLIWLLGLLEKKITRKVISIALFSILALANVGMTIKALGEGPTWFHDYGLAGMQYGGAQVFQAVEEYIEKNPKSQIIVSPTWANGTDIVARFFLDDPMPIQLASINAHINHHNLLDESMVFVMTAEEYDAAQDSGKFQEFQVEKILPYPDGQPGFYFVRLAYVEDIKSILAGEREQRRELQTAEIIQENQVVNVKHSLLDLGRIQDLWDDNLRTVARTFEANPFIIELTFPSPRIINGLSLSVGDTEVKVLARLYHNLESEPVDYNAKLEGSVIEPVVNIDFDAQTQVKILYLEVYDLQQTEPAHVHLWEVSFR